MASFDPVACMLKKHSPLLTPELIYVLAAMGHGDSLALVDANFPAASVARATPHGRAIYLPGADVPQALEVILSLLPLDTFVAEPIRRMLVVDNPEEIPQVQQEVAEVLARAEVETSVGGLDRFAFYESARACYAIVATGERQFYGNYMISKGIIGPDERN
jgi:L-fucose mutarotase